MIRIKDLSPLKSSNHSILLSLPWRSSTNSEIFLQILFTQGMTKDELESVTFLAKLNATLLEEENALSNLISSIAEERATVQSIKESAEANKNDILSLCRRIQTLEGQGRAAESNWAQQHFRDNDRIDHLEQNLLHRQSQKISSLEKEIEFLQKQIWIIEMSNQVAAYGSAIEQASRLHVQGNANEWPWYEKQYGFTPDFVWSLFRLEPDFIKLLNWHSSMKYFCVSLGKDFRTTTFFRDFHSLKNKTLQHVGDWTAAEFIFPNMSDLIKGDPGVKLFANLEAAYECEFTRYKKFIKETMAAS